MAYGDLIRVLADEAAREASALRARCADEALRVEAEARRTTSAARQALLAREEVEAEERRRVALGEVAQERERLLVAERRVILDQLRAEVARRLPAASDGEVLTRLVGEVLAAAPVAPARLLVDPGAEDAAREALAAGHPEARERITVEAAPAARGGVLLITGRLLLDDTLPARLERAWPALEPELARLLFGEG
jgi:vacuolar-type H+-ATPase subunit E/Vma4